VTGGTQGLAEPSTKHRYEKTATIASLMFMLEILSEAMPQQAPASVAIDGNQRVPARNCGISAIREAA